MRLRLSRKGLIFYHRTVGETSGRLLKRAKIIWSPLQSTPKLSNEPVASKHPTKRIIKPKHSPYRTPVKEHHTALRLKGAELGGNQEEMNLIAPRRRITNPTRTKSARLWNRGRGKKGRTETRTFRRRPPATSELSKPPSSLFGEERRRKQQTKSLGSWVDVVQKKWPSANLLEHELLSRAWRLCGRSWCSFRGEQNALPKSCQIN